MREHSSLTSLEWQKSSFCGNSTCIEVASTPSLVALRDSKDTDRPALVYSHEAWDAFLAGITAGEFDFPAP